MRTKIRVGFVGMWLCLSLTAPRSWAQCPLVVEHDFIGEVCPNSVPGRCLELGVQECRFGRWLLEEGGILEGTSKTFLIDSGSTTEGPRHVVTKEGSLRTPTFEGHYNSRATLLDWSRQVVWTGFETTEVRTGTETLPDGGVFVGEETTTTAFLNAQSSPSDTVVTMRKSGTLTTDTFTGTLTIESKQYRENVGAFDEHLNSSSTTTMDGVWTLAPGEQLQGALVTSVVNGVTTVTDNRSPLVVTPPETPWQTNAYGTLYLNGAWNYNMGYQFIPQVNGKITKLGGFFNGTKKVRLYDSSGSVLALADVTATDSWGYTAITPVQVTAGQTYTIAVNLAGSGGSYRSLGNAPLPKTFRNIQILKSVYRSNSELIPTSSSTSFMYGQADIEFVPASQ